MSKVFQINQTIDKMVKEKFLTIYNEAIKSATSKFQTEGKALLSNLSPFEKIKFLNTIRDGLNDKKNLLGINAYLKAGDNEDTLLKIFSSRTTLLNVDDTEILLKSVYFSKYGALISDELLKVKEELTEYSYEDFEKGKEDDVFFKLNYILHIKQEGDLDKIRFWQAKKMELMLSFETTRIINGLQTQYSNSIEYVQIFQSDIQLYKNILSPGVVSEIDDLAKEYGKLSFMQGYDFDLLNDKSALNDFNYFIEKEINWNRITPMTVDAARSRMDSLDGNYPIMFSPIIFYVVDQVIDWMKEVVNGQSLMQPFLYPRYKEIVESIIIEEESKAEKLLESFAKEIKKKNKEDQISAFVFSLNMIRVEMKDLNDAEKQYFGSIHRSTSEEIFTINALVFGLLEHESSLRKAASLYFRYVYFISAYSNLSGKNNLVFDGVNNDNNPSEIFYISSTMVVDNDLQDRLSNVYDDALKSIMVFAFPIDFVFQTMKEEIHQIFLECLDKLQSYLEDCEPGNKVLYIQSRLKELRQRELKLNSLSKLHNEQVDYGYTTLLKEYLEIEAEYITSTKDVHFFDALPEKPKKKSISAQKEILTFGYKYEDTQKLLDFVTRLTLKIDFINTRKTSAQNLVDVFMAVDLSIALPEIHLACETTQLSYIFDKLRPYFKNLTLKNIEESQLFYTKKGTLLKAQNLSASRIDNPKEQQEIDKAFSLLQ